MLTVFLGFINFFIMRKYIKIVREGSGDHIGHTTIKGLKLAIRQRKLKEGVFECSTPCGNTHLWKITTKEISLKGRTKNKIKIGKGVSAINTTALFLKNYKKIQQL